MGRVEISHSKARAVVQVATRKELNNTAHALLDRCLEEVPVRTGKLLASHRIERRSEEHLIISANTPYARAVYDGDQGRRPNRWFQRAIDRMRIG